MRMNRNVLPQMAQVRANASHGVVPRADGAAWLTRRPAPGA